MTLVGGKWTTYRACAEQIAEAVVKHLGKPHTNSTLNAPSAEAGACLADLQGLGRLRATISKVTGLPDDVIETLLRRYGAVASDVAAALSGSS